MAHFLKQLELIDTEMFRLQILLWFTVVLELLGKVDGCVLEGFFGRLHGHAVLRLERRLKLPGHVA